jgi:hypothetical protein
MAGRPRESSTSEAASAVTEITSGTHSTAMMPVLSVAALARIPT